MFDNLVKVFLKSRDFDALLAKVKKKLFLISMYKIIFKLLKPYHTLTLKLSLIDSKTLS